METIGRRIKHELSGRKLVWNVLFYIGHLSLFSYGWYKQARDARLAALNSLKYSVWISRGAGLCLGVDGLFIILAVLRNLIDSVRPWFSRIRGIRRIVPWDENIWCHRQFAYSILFWTIVHVTAHYVNMIQVERTQVRREAAWAILFTQPGGLTGHVMLVVMLLMYTTAHRQIRRECFEAFWFTHQLAFVFLIALYFHAIGCFVRGALPGRPVECLGYKSWQWCIVGGILYLIERLIRIVRSRRSTKLIAVLEHPGRTIELRFSKPSLRYRPGQWIYLNVPDIARFEWHPFTISSAPDDPFVSIHMRQAGDWTGALASRLGCREPTCPGLASESSSSSDHTRFSSIDLDKVVDGPQPSTSGERRKIDNTADIATIDILARAISFPAVAIDGPFGAPAQDVGSNEVAVLIGAGIGVTPFASILKDLWHKQRQRRPGRIGLGSLRRVLFVWINRDVENFEWFHRLLRSLEEDQTDPLFLTVQIYLTRPLDLDAINNIAIHHTAHVESSYGGIEGQGDCLTHLGTHTRFGRPRFDILFASIRTAIESGQYLPGIESSLIKTVGGE